MIRIRRYSNALEAEAAAGYLRENGIAASVVGGHVHGVFGLSSLRFAQLELVILDAAQQSSAEELLAQFEREGPELAPEWEREAEPDLSRIDTERVPITCAACGCPLRIGGRAEEACPECGAVNDVVDRIIAAHGPEGLAAALGAGEGAESGSTRRVPCPECGYPLEGPETRGRCPECGGLYDKGEDPARGH